MIIIKITKIDIRPSGYNGYWHNDMKGNIIDDHLYMMMPNSVP